MRPTVTLDIDPLNQAAQDFGGFGAGAGIIESRLKVLNSLAVEARETGMQAGRRRDALCDLFLQFSSLSLEVLQPL